MTDHDAVLETLRAIVARVAWPRRAPSAVPDRDAPLRDGGWWLDSLGLLEVIVACEAEFGILFEPAQDLVSGALETLGTLAALIHEKSARTSPAPGGS